MLIDNAYIPKNRISLGELTLKIEYIYEACHQQASDARPLDVTYLLHQPTFNSYNHIRIIINVKVKQLAMLTRSPLYQEILC